MNIDQKILDDVQLITAGGYDYLEADMLQTTAVTPNYQPDKSVINETYTASSKLNKEVRSKINEQSDKPFVSGKIQVALYSRRLAEEGMIDTIDTLQRDPSVGSNVYLGIVEGSAKELLEKQYGNADNGNYLSSLIEQNIETGTIPKTNLHEFIYAYYAEGMDPFLPLLGSENSRVDIKGIAFFKSDQYVHQIAEEEKQFLFKILYENKSSEGSMPIELGEDGKDGEYASVFNINSKRSYDIQKPMTDSDITIHMKIKGVLREFTGKKVDKKSISMIESKMKEAIEKQGSELIKEFQELNIDPLGIGEQVRTRTRNWDQKKWQEIYPTIEVNVKTSVKILETGVIE
ncbi:Ger(x)C family spore germination protein [Metabacillus herbersteinensis]|uniref:Ger(X)C family spore germination protein n=1 Tax=Metabacillus herbersteinensis TaxID=283816 RepID=A0ABV6G870_9BACI